MLILKDTYHQKKKKKERYIPPNLTSELCFVTCKGLSQMQAQDEAQDEVIWFRNSAVYPEKSLQKLQELKQRNCT